jgi:hypothetical protein
MASCEKNCRGSVAVASDMATERGELGEGVRIDLVDNIMCYKLCNWNWIL